MRNEENDRDNSDFLERELRLDRVGPRSDRNKGHEKVQSAGPQESGLERFGRLSSEGVQDMRNTKEARRMRDGILNQIDMLERDIRGLNPKTSSFINRKAKLDILYKQLAALE